MAKKQNTSKSTKANVAAVQTPVTNTVTFVSPRGKQYSVSNISKFARRFNLDRSALSRIASGVRTSHKGWTALRG